MNALGNLPPIWDKGPVHRLERELHALLPDPRMRDFIERAGNGIWIWDLKPDGEGWVSPAFGRLLGFEPHEITQGPAFWRERTHPDDWPRVLDAIQQAMRFDTPYEIVARVQHKDARYRWLQSYGLVFRDADGAPSYGIGMQRDITELMHAKEQLERESTHDALTGLLNRRGIIDALQRTIQQVQRIHCQAYAILFDLDNFKSINDRFGHAGGDCVLEEVGQRLRRAVRVVDEIGRIGGDEFVIFLLARDRDEAEYVATRVHEEVSAEPVYYAGEPAMVTLSAALLPIFMNERARIDRLETLLQAAGPYLQRSKENGKNQIVRASVRPSAGEP